ncbi:hypothetical protein [Ekhidna sp.]|uniref:hypothetical protein n=1 Tax=Ekhidna sp. TaxID=2608089 RepID=UPI003CCBD106
MKNLFFLCLLIVSLSGCNDEGCAAASCIAPPNGEFASDEYNIAIYESISDGSNQIRIDSVILAAGVNIVIKDFYTWVVVENPDEVSSLTLYSGENQYIVNDALPEISNRLKGYLIGFVKDGETILINGVEASEDLINGVCNDTINC